MKTTPPELGVIDRHAIQMTNGHENPKAITKSIWLSLFSYLLFLIAAGLLVWWVAAGHHPWTTTQHLVSVPATDPLFGTTVMTQKWVHEFTPGIEMIGPIVLVLVGLGLWLLRLARKKAKNM